MDLKSSHRKKNIVLEYPHYSYDAKIDTYYDLPHLLPCFQPVQLHTNYDHKPPYADVKSVTDSMVTYESEREKNEWFETEIEKFKRMQQKKDRESIETGRQIQATCLKNWEAQIDVLTKKCREEGANNVPRPPDKEDVSSKNLPCQLPPKELNPGRCGKKARINKTDPTIPKVHICKLVKQDCDETFKIWPTCDPTKKVCNRGEDIYGINEKGKLRE
ncbi:hypothetical protein Tco_0928120 [Tanacetum coccineum]